MFSIVDEGGFFFLLFFSVFFFFLAMVKSTRIKLHTHKFVHEHIIMFELGLLGV